MKLRTYVIQDDFGSAPNYDPPGVTLAICKPKIRKGAVLGDVVLAFEGSGLGANPHAVVWAGVVEEKLTFASYWRDSRFRNKRPDRTPVPDNIYEPVGHEYRQVANPIHGRGNVSTDLGGVFVLVCRPAWHFSGPRPNLPAECGFRMPMSARRGHRVHELSPAERDGLRAWLESESAKRAAPDAGEAGRSYLRAPRSARNPCAPSRQAAKRTPRC
ncbi:MAG: hypothetical protein JSS86_00630 [Cyanobacteria bacterium SZAS LIN-2]|nr:hypothetical protein [Cyanobacteria bacterium SZAS LIN-2]